VTERALLAWTEHGATRRIQLASCKAR
jgi:hypothetical protein